jgi:hypothetical protein
LMGLEGINDVQIEVGSSAHSQPGQHRPGGPWSTG